MCCENHHCFDLAKSGYVNLSRASSKGGDNKEMVHARSTFLERGYYAPLKDELQKLTQTLCLKTLADLGCGEGYYTRSLSAEEKYGFDMSKEALIHACKKDCETQYVLASIFHLPLSDESMDGMLTCFAPFAKEEVERILKPEGHFIFVSPGPHHLYELKEALYEKPYLNKVDELNTVLTKEKEYTVKSTFLCESSDLLALFHMTPYAYKTGMEGKERLEKINQLSLTMEMVIRIYKK